MFYFVISSLLIQYTNPYNIIQTTDYESVNIVQKYTHCMDYNYVIRTWYEYKHYISNL